MSREKVLPSTTRVKLLITKHILITKHFPIFSSFINQIEQFLCPGHKLEGYKQTFINTGRRWMIVCFKRFEKITLDFSLVPVPISSLFLVCIEWYKTWWMHQLGLYRTSLNSKGKDATIKDFKLEILICLVKPTEHWTTLHQTPHIVPTPLPNWGLQMFFEVQKQRNNVSGFNLKWVCKCSLTGLSTMNLNIFTMGCQQRTFNFKSRKPRVYNREKQLITKNANPQAIE